MANKKNLIPQAHTLTVDEQSKGGQKSAETRKQKRLLKDCMLELLKMPVKDTEKYNVLAQMGINPKEIDNNTLLTVGLFAKAVGGDVAAFKEIRNLIGEDTASGGDGELEKLMEGFKEV